MVKSSSPSPRLSHWTQFVLWVGCLLSQRASLAEPSLEGHSGRVCYLPCITNPLDFLQHLSHGRYSTGRGRRGESRRKTKPDLGFCFAFTVQARCVVAFYCLMSAFKGVCHLPGNRGFSLLVTHELEPRCTDAVNKRTDEAAGAEPAAVCRLHRGRPTAVAGAGTPLGVPGHPGSRSRGPAFFPGPVLPSFWVQGPCGLGHLGQSFAASRRENQIWNGERGRGEMKHPAQEGLVRLFLLS